MRATYGANFERLVKVKEKYDPDNLFRRNRNIRPPPRRHHEERRSGRLRVCIRNRACDLDQRERVSCRALAELYIGRIHQHNPALHAIVISNEADAIRTARERDDDLTNNIVRGPLHGVPVTVKESFNLAGLKTTVNFPQLKNNVAATDALIVKRLKEAGAIHPRQDQHPDDAERLPEFRAALSDREQSL